MNRIACNAHCSKCVNAKKAFEQFKFPFLFNELRKCLIARFAFQLRISKPLITKSFSNARNTPLTGGVRAPPLTRSRARHSNLFQLSKFKS